MLVSGVFDQPTSVLFLDDGVLQLVGRQDATIVNRKDTAKALTALSAYEVDEIYASQSSLEDRGVDVDALALKVEIIDDARCAELLHATDVVVTD